MQALLQCFSGGVNRVRAQHQGVAMLGRRAHLESAIAPCGERDGGMARFKHRELGMHMLAVGLQSAGVCKGPGHVMRGRWLVTPRLPIFQLHPQVVGVERCLYGVDGFTVLAQQDRHRAVDRHVVRLDERGAWRLVQMGVIQRCLSMGKPNGVMSTAKNQITGPLMLSTLKAITPEVTMASKKVMSAMPMMTTPKK